jgi:putative DNA primase/helicase
VNAERDEDGVPIGLSLRSQSDLKVMYPGSKHGLVYEVNPDHERGGGGYQAGPSNWVRTMDAGHVCPICGKPDGCLLSAENPADPKAAVCIRIRQGSVKPLKFGHLHIRKAEGNLHGAAALANHNGPVLIVEGMSDTAAALDLGFDGVGRPSNLACMDMLSRLVRGRECIVVGENDKKSDGRWPGREGMIAAWQTVKRVCPRATMLMPPEHVKDLRAWVAKYKLTREKLLEYHNEHAEEHAEELVVNDNRPLTIARAYLGSQFRLAGRYTLRRWAGSWYRYTGSKYEPVTDEAFRQPVYAWADDKQVRQVDAKSGAESLQPLVANNTMIANLAEAIMSETLVGETKLPCWINERKGPDPKDLIVFNNGILHVPSFLNGEAESRYLLDATPDLFTTAALPFAFDPTATAPTWEGFLVSSLGDDPAKIELLREWFGYCMTPDTSMQKLMFLRGVSGAGKSVILNTLVSLVGDEQAASTSFGKLSGDFGIQAMMGKLVCVIPDARTPRYGDAMQGLEILLNIASGDGVQINRKFKDPIERHKLIARITIASNEFLEVPDHSGAMLRRLNIVEFTRSHVGHEDFHLDDKLAAETPGIAIWALSGLRRLRENGRFTEPESSVLAKQEWRTSTSPLAAFLEECTDAEAGEVLKSELYDAWSKWAAERKITPLSMSRFIERIRSNAPYAVSDTHEKGGHKFSVFRGLTLKKWAARQYLGKPT